MQRNPLLAKPPVHRHRLSQEQRLTKHGWAAPHLGVHVALEKRIAAAYAYSAISRPGYTLPSDDYPVVVTLNTEGLVAEPDVDALLWWYERGGIEQAREVVKLLREKPDAHIYDYLESGDDQFYTVSAVLLNVLHVDWENIREEIGLEGIEEALVFHDPLRRLLLAGFPQRRFLSDFDLDRVVSIDTFRPYWDEFIDEELSDREPEEEAEEIEKMGFEPVWRGDVDHFEPTYKTLYRGPRCDSCHEYHGTSGEVIRAAFPELNLPEGGWRELWS